MPSVLRNKEKLNAAMSKASSMKECLISLGLRAAGGNYKALIKACEDFKIPIKRSTGIDKIKTAIAFKTIPLEDILVKDSNYSSRSMLKKRLLKEGLLENACAHCNNGPLWNGKSLSLQLDHINGVHNDHRLSNLCLLCPNCHSQTATFAGRNSRRK